MSPDSEGREAAAVGFGLARRAGASVELGSVVDPTSYSAGAYVVPGWTAAQNVDFTAMDRHVLGAAERAIDDLGAGVTVQAEVRRGAVVPTLAEASRAYDILVCGSRGYGAVHRAFAGGVSRGLAHAAACPLLLVPRRLEADADVLWTGRTAASTR